MWDGGGALVHTTLFAVVGTAAVCTGAVHMTGMLMARVRGRRRCVTVAIRVPAMAMRRHSVAVRRVARVRRQAWDADAAVLGRMRFETRRQRTRCVGAPARRRAR